MAVNVYTSLSNATVYTDKLRISTGTSPVTFQVYQVATSSGGNPYGSNVAAGNLYSTAIQIPANNSKDVFCGAQNKVTVTGTGYTATELGTASSGLNAVIGLPAY